MNARFRWSQALRLAMMMLALSLLVPDRAAGSRATLGVTTRNDSGRLVVAPAAKDAAPNGTGLMTDDEILAINDRRVTADQLNRRLDEHKPGERISLLIARRGQLLRQDVVLSSQPPTQWDLEVDPAATDAQRSRLAAWLPIPAD